MKLTFIRSTSPTQDTCPNIYITDRGTVVVQGSRLTDTEALAQMRIPDHETCVEVPMALVREIFENA